MDAKLNLMNIKKLTMIGRICSLRHVDHEDIWDLHRARMNLKIQQPFSEPLNFFIFSLSFIFNYKSINMRFCTAVQSASAACSFTIHVGGHDSEHSAYQQGAYPDGSFFTTVLWLECAFCPADVAIEILGCYFPLWAHLNLMDKVVPTESYRLAVILA